MNRRLVASTLLAATLVLSACGAAGSGSGPDTDLVIGQVTEPERSPDPIVDGSLAGYNYYYNLFDQLTALDADGAVQPKLATSWEPSADFTTWTFHLRDDVTFSNGEKLTARDVAFTYDTILKTPDSDNLSYMQQLSGVEAPDDRTVVFRLNTPFSPWPSITTAVSIVPQDVYTELGSEGFAKAPVGSGPFTFVSWTRGVDYVMRRNDSYWGAKPAADEVTFQTVADENARLSGVQSGSLDLALISPNQVDSLEGDPQVTVASRTSNGVTFLGMNSTQGVLADQRVREAISKAVDLDTIAEKVLAGRATPNSQLVAPNVAGFVEGFPNAAYDPAGAKALLAQAGYDGTPVPFEYATDGRIPLSSDVAQAVQGYLEAVGLRVKMIGTDQASLSDTIYSSVSVQGLYLNTWAPSTMDGDMPVTNMFAGGQNDYAKSPDTAALVTQQRAVGGADRTEVFRQLATLNSERAYLLGLYTPDTDYAVNPDLRWTPRADGEIVLSDITFAEGNS